MGLLLNFVPSSLLDAFIDGETLQILFNPYCLHWPYVRC